MPTLDISLEDLNRLTGKKFTAKGLEEALGYVKGEIESLDGDRIKIEIADTNRPDLWSTEGIARELRARFTKDTGLVKFRTKKSGLKVIVDRNLKGIRPKTACAVVKGLNIDDESLFQIIQLQEKICENFGRGRREVALGIYDYSSIAPPVHFRAYRPDAISFIPLDFDRELKLDEVLSQHPKGREYGHLLAGLRMYPVFVDSKGSVLSMPPIINSDYSGKVTENTKDVFIECSGFDMKFLMPALNVMVAALAERGGSIETVDVIFPEGKIETPDFRPKKIAVGLDRIKSLSGLDLKTADVKRLLLASRYGIETGGREFIVACPAYRQDIMHDVDVIEDILISYGYNRIGPIKPRLASNGELTPINVLSRVAADIMIGLGSQEILSYILTNRSNLIEKMGAESTKFIEIDKPVSKTWSVFRTWLLPSLMEFLSSNTSNEYPQNIFEIGEVVLFDAKAETRTRSPAKMAWAYAGADANFTKAKQGLDSLMNGLGINYGIVEMEHSSFIEGRVGKIVASDGSDIALVGEVHPKVLENFGVEQPVCAFEVDLDAISRLIKS